MQSRRSELAGFAQAVPVSKSDGPLGSPADAIAKTESDACDAAIGRLAVVLASWRNRQISVPPAMRAAVASTRGWHQPRALARVAYQPRSQEPSANMSRAVHACRRIASAAVHAAVSVIAAICSILLASIPRLPYRALREMHHRPANCSTVKRLLTAVPETDSRRDSAGAVAAAGVGEN